MKNQEQSMIDLTALRKIYFIGIGGIGMSAIARFFRGRGIEVEGYDKTESSLTRQLEAEGMKIHYAERTDLIPKDADLVVYTPAIPKDHSELVYYQNEGYRVVKRSDVLQAISATTFNICVGGTHGKTTISAMTAHILRHSGFGCQAFLGGIAVNYHTNYWNTNSEVSVIEADEYDRSFLKLSPDIAVITAMDADHLDIYGDERSMQDAFIAFGNRVKEGGLLIAKFGLSRIKEISAKTKLSYSAQNDSADVYAASIQMNEGGYRFDVSLNGELLPGFELRIGGMHNVENSLVAITVAHRLGIDTGKIREAVAAFQGVKRRFEYVLAPVKTQKGAFVAPVLIDDYAHHPEELSALLKSVRSLFPQRKITVVFQPHLFTRTRDLADGFAEALSIADRILLLPIYPARELPLEGVTSNLILDKVKKENKMLVTKEQLMEWMDHHQKELDKEFGEVIVMAGAGDIDTLVAPIAEILKR